MGNATSVIATYLVLLLVFRFGVALACGPKAATAGDGWLRRNFARPVPSHTLWTLIVPVGGVVILSFYRDPPVPWLDMFGLCLSYLAYTLGGIMLRFRSQQSEVLGLRSRSSIIVAAIFFFAIGLLIVNRDAFSS